MRRINLLTLVLLNVIALSGCDTPKPAAGPTTPQSIEATATPIAIKEDKASSGKPEEQPVRRARPAAEKGKVAQLFQVPQFTLPATGNGSNYDGPRLEGPGAPPQIRLLGFSRYNEQFKALVQVRGEILAIEQGEVIDGAEVVAVDAEGVSFQFAGQRWTTRLFEKSSQPAVNVARVEKEAASDPRPTLGPQPAIAGQAVSN